MKRRLRSGADGIISEVVSGVTDSRDFQRIKDYMTGFEWFLLIIVVIVVPLIVAGVVTIWTIDQANKRKRANRKDAQIGVKRNASLSPEETAARLAARADRLAAESELQTIPEEPQSATQDVLAK